VCILYIYNVEHFGIHSIHTNISPMITSDFECVPLCVYPSFLSFLTKKGQKTPFEQAFLGGEQVFLGGEQVIFRIKKGGNKSF